MLLSKALSYFRWKVLWPLEKFIRSLNESLLNESKIKLIGNYDESNETIQQDVQEKQEENAENVKYVYMDESMNDFRDLGIYDGHVNAVISKVISAAEVEYSNDLFHDWVSTAYNIGPGIFQNILVGVSLSMFTVFLGCLMFAASTYIGHDELPVTEDEEFDHMDPTRTRLEKEDQVIIKPILRSNSNIFLGKKGKMHIEAKAHLSNEPFDFLTRYDCILNENLNSIKGKTSNAADVMFPNIEMNTHVSKLKPAFNIEIQPHDMDQDELFEFSQKGNLGDTSFHVHPFNDNTSFQYFPLLRCSSELSSNSSHHQTIESDIQNNSINTDAEFEKSQQSCLLSMLHLYNQTHSNSITSLPNQKQSGNKGIGESDNEWNQVQAYSLGHIQQNFRSSTPSSSLENGVSASDLLLQNCLNKTQIAPKVQKSTLNTKSKFELSEVIQNLISNNQVDPFEFFDLCDHLIIANEKLEELRMLSLCYGNNVSNAHKLIELEVSSLITSTETEKQSTLRKLSYIISIEYNGDDPNIPSIINMYNECIKIHINQLIQLLSTPSYDSMLQFLRDYLSFADNNKIELEIYKTCLEAMFQIMETKDNPNKLISKSIYIVVCALDSKMLQNTFFTVFNEMFTDKTSCPSKQLCVLESLKYYICFNKTKIVRELVENPIANKVNCCGYQLIKLLTSNIGNIISSSQMSKLPRISSCPRYYKTPPINSSCCPVLLGLIETYLAIVEVFLNNNLIPSPIQYDLLSSFITKLYSLIKPIAENDLRELELPIIKELQIHHDLIE